MSLERDGNRVEMCCDACPAGLGKSYPDEDFDIMCADAKQRGWQIKKVGVKWKHFCPQCRN